jgi:hypothetical protein
MAQSANSKHGAEFKNRTRVACASEKRARLAMVAQVGANGWLNVDSISSLSILATNLQFRLSGSSERFDFEPAIERSRSCVVRRSGEN